MTERCDLCQSDDLSAVYQAAPSPRGLTVYLCGHCGLAQSLPRIDHVREDAVRRVSAGADWGNIRYGKGFRAEANFRLIGPHLPANGALKVLDVGANRGAFALKLAGLRSDAAIAAVEPDTSVAHAWSTHPQIDYLPARIEHVIHAPDQFDLIYSCHTIEHLKSPRDVMLRHWRALKPGGLLFLEAPNVAFVAEPDVVEEFFIDKHLYHFSASTLAALAEASGFSTIEGAAPGDHQNVTLLLRKDREPRQAVPANASEAARTAQLIVEYRWRRKDNLAALSKVAAALTKDPKRRIAVWGAGRLLHCLIEHGKLDPTSLAAVVDTNLSSHMRNVHGVPLTAPENLPAVDPDMIVVMSRAFAGEIERQARRHAPRAEIESYASLLANAKRA